MIKPRVKPNKHAPSVAGSIETLMNKLLSEIDNTIPITRSTFLLVFMIHNLNCILSLHYLNIFMWFRY